MNDPANTEQIKIEARKEWKRGGRQALPWSERVNELEELVGAGWGVARMAKKYGVTPPTMRKWLKRLGLQTVWQR